jgi:modification methylase
VLKDDGTLWVIGSYHNIFRVGAALQDQGYWISTTSSGARPTHAQFPRHPLHQRARDVDLVRQGRGEPLPLQLRAMKALNDELQMRSDWLLPICSGGERVKARSGHKAHPTQKPESLLYRVLLACTQPGMSCWIRSSARARPARWRGGWGASGSGSRRKRNTAPVAEERIASTLPLDESAIETMQEKKSTPRVPFGALIETG